MVDNYLKNSMESNSGNFLQDVLSALPRGYEKTFLVIYMILVPYILGLLFFLFTIGAGIFHILSNIPYVVTWLVGYEVFSVLILLYIVNKTVFFTIR